MFAEQPVAIIDIGSNSVRLVVYSGAKRIPSVIFNEKVLAGLVRELGFEPRILSGEEEGKRAGQGVLSAIPDADGVVGDLGGGSLELVEVSGGKVVRRASLPPAALRGAALIGT